jgi:hypothetical protein
MLHSMVETWLCQVTMCSREICSSICSLWMGSFAWLAWLPLRSMVRRMLKPLKARNWHYILHVRIHYSGLTSSVRLQNLSTQEVISQYQKKTSRHVLSVSPFNIFSRCILVGAKHAIYAPARRHPAGSGCPQQQAWSKLMLASLVTTQDMSFPKWIFQNEASNYWIKSNLIALSQQ